MKKSLLISIVILSFLFCSIGLAQNQPVARDLVASLAQLPGLADSPDKGVFVDLVKAIAEVYPNGKIKIGVYPFARSINNVIDDKADFHVPSIRNPIIPEAQLPYRFVSEKMGTVSFVIYSNKNKVITNKTIKDALSKGGQFPYTIEVPGGLESNFPFPGQPCNNIEQGLEKVQNKRLDALIWAQEEVDLSLKKLQLKEITRSHWADLDDVIVIPKGPKGDELDKILSDCLKKLKSSGRLQELHNKVHLPYNDWQL